MTVEKQIEYKHINPIVKRIKSNSTKKIYHYTSPRGLHSILMNSTLRFSDVQFLNDKSEYIHIEKPLKKAFENIDRSISFSYDDVIALLDKKYETDDIKVSGIGWNTTFEFTKMRYYVFCTSKLEDSLGMWNYYVKDGKYQGYNIGITVNQILNCFDSIKELKSSVLYGEVIYSEDEQVEILASILIDINNRLEAKILENNKLKDEDRDQENQVAYQESFGEILSNIDSLRLFFKDNAFKNENEFRFVLKLPKEYSSSEVDILTVGFDVKNGIFTPYCDLKMDKKRTINSIMLAPIMEGELAKIGLERILKHYGYKTDIHIAQSVVPIRY